jgi:hypothetical protein
MASAEGVERDHEVDVVVVIHHVLGRDPWTAPATAATFIAPPKGTGQIGYR